MSADHLRHSAQLSSTTINSFKVACVVHSPPTSTLHPATTVSCDDQQVGAVRKADTNDDHVEIPGGERSQRPLSGRSNAPVRERCLQDFFAPSGHHNPQRICRRQDLRTLTRGRIDPFGVDPGPERLDFSAGQRYLAIPALGRQHPTAAGPGRSRTWAAHTESSLPRSGQPRRCVRWSAPGSSRAGRTSSPRCPRHRWRHARSRRWRTPRRHSSP